MNSFSYCFSTYNNEYPATLKLNKIKKELIIKDKNQNISIKPLKVRHGKVDSICYFINTDLAYISDISEISKKDYKKFLNLKYLIIDCLWYRNHPSHLNLEKTLELIKIFKPKKSILTNLHNDLDYNELNKILPKNVVPAYDGMKINL